MYASATWFSSWRIYFYMTLSFYFIWISWTSWKDSCSITIRVYPWMLLYCSEINCYEEFTSTRYFRKINQLFFSFHFALPDGFKGHFSKYVIDEFSFLTGHRFFLIYRQVIRLCLIFFCSIVSSSFSLSFIAIVQLKVGFFIFSSHACLFFWVFVVSFILFFVLIGFSAHPA